jgi:hypothetical protein
MSVRKPANFESLVRRIERSNKRFESATATQKIVMVSQDVLDMLELERIKARHMIYVKIPLCVSNIQPNLSGNVQISDVLKLPELPVCSVCAIGAGMVAATLRKNDVVAPKSYASADFNYRNSPESNFEGEGMSLRAQEVFGKRLLRSMEQAFEDGEYNYHRTERGDSRMKAIYKNLIKNKGEKFTHYQANNFVIWTIGEQ